MIDEKEDHKIHFDEFKMYLESAEKTTDRRLDLNKNNSSISLLIIGGIFAILSWSSEKNNMQIISLLAIILISFIAIIFCFLWYRQIISYKELNNAKFNVINNMAPRIFFSNDEDRVCRSGEPFAKEWDILKKNKSLNETKFGKFGLALSSSYYEIIFPISFIFIFSSIFVFSIIMLIY